MQKSIIGAAIGATLLCALPASAQVVVHESATIGVAHPHRHWHHRHHWRGAYASCTVQHVRTRRKDGTVVVTTRRLC
ncbi:MAG TPA: hypothetical protein VG986_07210 [Pseudolabrys sp.]|nr:hypothetical protein [Pseudolabrys sp.]